MFSQCGNPSQSLCMPPHARTRQDEQTRRSEQPLPIASSVPETSTACPCSIHGASYAPKDAFTQTPSSSCRIHSRQAHVRSLSPAQSCPSLIHARNTSFIPYPIACTQYNKKSTRPQKTIGLPMLASTQTYARIHLAEMTFSKYGPRAAKQPLMHMPQW